MALKGHTKIELTNVHTGEKEVVEHHNMITNVLSDMNKRVWGANGMDTFLYMYAKQFLGTNDPFWKAFFTGIILFEDALTDDPSEYIFPAGNKVVGCGDIYRVKTSDFSDKSCSVMGNFNSDESVLKDNMVKMVYDFPTSQGNGTISSIALCNHLLARSCYVYGKNAGVVQINSRLGNNGTLMKNTAFQSMSNDGNTYTISFYYRDTENLQVKLSSKVNLNGILTNNLKTISVKLDASDYTIYGCVCDENILALYSSTTRKLKRVCLTDGSVSEKTRPSGYDAVFLYDGYFVAIKKTGSKYYYSVLKDDGTMLHENVFSYGSVLHSACGMFNNRYVIFYDRTWSFLLDVLNGTVSKFYLNNGDTGSYYGDNNGYLFDNIFQPLGIYVYNGTTYYNYCSTWQPWLATKNNLDAPVTKTADKTMKVTYTLTEA